MSLYVDQLSALLFKSNDGRELVNQLNTTLRKLIYNDTSLVSNNQIAPQIWECKWLNDNSIKGYPKGFAVWMNTDRYVDVVNAQHQHVLDVVQRNGILGPLLTAHSGSNAEINDFLLKAAKGEIARNVPAIYCLGDVDDHVQIRVSKIDNNKEYPSNDDAWEDFYVRSTVESNTSAMMDELDEALQDGYAKHLAEWHIDGLTDEMLKNSGFFPSHPFNVNDVQQQHFFDHTYCTSMNGFDYVVSWKINDDKTQWCRLWKSGYLEQGGFASNKANADFIDIKFMLNYNYPRGTSFYSQGYSHYGDSSREINCALSNSKRYIVTISPILKNNAQTTYPQQPKNVSNELVYSCVDVTNIANDGFSIVNIDSAAALYEKYSWHVAGYTIPA